MRACRLIIHGRVQGVGYRDWLMNIAHLHKLHGWVRNITDGTVEAVLAGPEPALTACLATCHEGPALANVTKIEILPYEGRVAPGFAREPTSRPSRQNSGKCL